MRFELVAFGLGLMACAPKPPQRPSPQDAPLMAEARPAPPEVDGVQSLYGSDGRPIAEAPSAVMPLREEVTLVPTQRERDFAGVGAAHPPRVGRRNVNVRGARLDNTLRMLAEHGRFNLVLPNTLAEPVTLRLHGVEPYEALLVVARNHGLDVLYAGDVVTVTPAGTL